LHTCQDGKVYDIVDSAAKSLMGIRFSELSHI